MKDEPAGRCRRVDVLGQRPEARATGLDRLHQVEQIPQRARETVILGDDHHVVRAKLIEHPAQFGSVPFRATDLVCKDAFCTGCCQGVGLSIEGLVVGRYMR